MTVANGRLLDSALVYVSGVTGCRMRRGAAASWEVLRRAVHDTYGWWPTQTGPSDAYRAYEVQEAIFRARYTTNYLPGRPTKVWLGRTWWLLPGKATAAVPGSSNHGLGTTVDVTELGGFAGTRYKQFAAIAILLGWSNAEGRSIGEAWHWTYTGPADLTSNPGRGEGVAQSVPHQIRPAPPREWDEMASEQQVKSLIQTENAEVIRQLTLIMAEQIEQRLTPLKAASSFIASGPLRPDDDDDFTPGVRHFYVCDPSTMTRRHLSTQDALARARERIPEISDRMAAPWIRAFTLVK